ncbi:hypothetical protein [Streptomyces clavuligerus]|uniref:Putative protease B n=1 Tax=Streptomyces clavuligerus TaxID=1901 RepID=D5SKK2_STRCL|nr:hypothetical protein [Streptomyces clavuligerus]ANW22672.1 peptidase [Streptomyces clavuligerus]AXU17543.1 peptidase [Streptomyces clavuligerus]EFG04445.1 Putative protease B [Streptomyces clavuligerus]MBY6307096.1 peptidase [Streptomyces clavuligerus]QCS10942.1 peptidase [Streptomyces clavuligerus]
MPIPFSRRPVLSLGALALAGLTITGLTAVPSHAARPATAGVESSGAAFLVKHQRVGVVADALVAASRTLPRQGGYAGLITAPERSSITLYWKGGVPAQVRQAMRSDRRVKVRVATAPYTEHQLKTARDRVVRQWGALPGLTSIGPSPDGKGLLVGVAAEGGKPVAARKATAFSRGVSGITGGVAVVKVESASPEASVGKASVGARAVGRNGQQAYGGARWMFTKDGQQYVCSTAFGVRYPGTAVQLTTSAAHCGSQWGKAYSPEYPSSRPFAWIDTATHDRDASILYPEQNGANRFFQPRIWWGPWVGSPSGQKTLPVRGLNGNHVGQRVCSSGASSGTICDLRIEATEKTIWLSGSQPVYRTVQVSKPAGQAVWGPGDSGGPVAQNNGDHVWANGIVSASDKGNHPAACQGDTSRACASKGWYAALNTYLDEQGLELLTQ